MKAILFDSKGAEKSQVELPKKLSSVIREDLALKLFEVEKLQNMLWHSPFDEAGKRHSASGTISHRRHEWKGHYGKGIARVPRKAIWRRGTQFNWIGTEVASTRGGRIAHGPSGVRTPVKLNRKETLLAMNSAFASTVSKDFVLKRYASLKDIKEVPFVIESLPTKTKDLLETVKKMLGESYSLALKKKEVRSGKGKRRGRKYKSSAGLLIIKSEKENQKFKGFDVKTPKQVTISDLYPLGRLTLYTKAALEELK